MNARSDSGIFTIRLLGLLVMGIMLAIFVITVVKLNKPESKDDSWFNDEGQEELYRDFT
jgi:hypothetical protein